jgi:hypothetical protein
MELILSDAKVEQIYELSTKALTLQQIIMALNALSKVCGNFHVFACLFFRFGSSLISL